MNTGIVMIGLAFVLLSGAMMVTPSAAVAATPVGPEDYITNAIPDDPVADTLFNESAQGTLSIPMILATTSPILLTGLCERCIHHIP